MKPNTVKTQDVDICDKSRFYKLFVFKNKDNFYRKIPGREINDNILEIN